MSNFDDLLKPLRGLYLSQLRERARTVETFLANCRSGQISAEERSVMAGLSHKLAGSGTTYGYPLITQSARLLEQALADSRLEAPTLALVAESLSHSCAQALLAIERESSDVAVRSAPPPSSGKPLMLTVGDDPIVRETMVDLFGRDFEVATATNATTALALVQGRSPRLVVVDQTSPHQTADTALDALTQSGDAARAVPVLVIRGQDQSGPQDAIDASQVLDFINKPLDPEALAIKVRSLLHRSGLTVLIADDDPAIRDLLAYKFSLVGVRVLMAVDGEEAWRLCETYRPQLAILDRMMPGLDGVAVLRKMRGNPQTREIPVMFLTALRQEKDILEGFRTGVSDYVVKPFLPEEVLVRGMRLLGLDSLDVL